MTMDGSHCKSGIHHLFASHGARAAQAILAALLLLAPAAGALTIRLDVQARAKFSHLSLVALGDDGSVAKERALSAKEIRAGRISVTWPNGVAALRCQGPGIWCPVISIAKPAPPEVTLPVWPGGTASVKIAAPPGMAVPATILVEGSPVTGSG
ncbi:MAG TPA: hypothetical protein VKA53_00720, partial [Thermoanaerobaculia bacterium]|nr:hypothetical protein [Thermoanaerobaculia bacterium]